MHEEEAPLALLPMDMQHLSKGALRILAKDPHLDPSLLEQVLIQEKNDTETVRSLIRNPSVSDEAFNKVLSDLPEELVQEVGARQKALVSHEQKPTRPVKSGSRQQGDSGQGGSTQKRVTQLSPVEKIAFALKGPKEARSILIRDASKEVSLTVLKNPKITESEIEFYAASTNVSDDVQREIGRNREWCKKYNVLRALVFNPKTPVGVSLEKLPYIKDKDLQFLSKSKNIPNAVSTTAKRMVAKKQRKKG